METEAKEDGEDRLTINMGREEDGSKDIDRGIRKMVTRNREKNREIK